MVVSVRARVIEEHSMHSSRICARTGYRGEISRQSTPSIEILPVRRDCECNGRETPSLFTTFTHVMKADADSQERLLTLICDTLERAVLHSDNIQVNLVNETKITERRILIDKMCSRRTPQLVFSKVIDCPRHHRNMFSV